MPVYWKDQLRIRGNIRELVHRGKTVTGSRVDHITQHTVVARSLTFAIQYTHRTTLLWLDKDSIVCSTRKKSVQRGQTSRQTDDTHALRIDEREKEWFVCERDMNEWLHDTGFDKPRSRVPVDGNVQHEGFRWILRETWNLLRYYYLEKHWGRGTPVRKRRTVETREDDKHRLRWERRGFETYVEREREKARGRGTVRIRWLPRG